MKISGELNASATSNGSVGRPASGFGRKKERKIF